ncbi:lipoprotein BA_5634 family protein [Bacillus cereus]|uniref:lipoprotein BA_5634 family protein n=1 Tax=Bacillus cereus TaxID=1396 RepID=UPI003D6468A9
MTSLPTIPKGKVMMFTSNKDKEIKEIKINDKNIKVQYEDDISLGLVRIPTYEEVILIVDATTFKDFSGTETYMEVLHFNKSYGENKTFDPDDPKELQTWYEWKKFTKDMKEEVSSFNTVSIIKK